jgi:hypothetical protein
MRILITESKIKQIAIKWLEDNYPDLELLKYPAYEEVFISDNGMFKMSYISRTKSLHVMDEIWDFIHKAFGLDNDEVSKILLDWGNNKFKFRAKKCYRVERI